VKCPIESTQSVLIFQDAVYAEFGFVFYIYGCYLGMVYDAKNFKGTPSNVNDTTFFKTILRVFFSCFPIFLIYIVPAYLLPKNGNVIGVLIAFSLSTMAIGFVLNAYSREAYIRYELVRQEQADSERLMNLGRIEEEEEIREIRGKPMSKLASEGAKAENTF